MDIREELISYFTTIEEYDYNGVECNADYIFENAMAYRDILSKIMLNEDKCILEDIFRLSLYYISEKNIDVMLDFFKNEMKHERVIEKEMLGILKSNRNLTLNQLRDTCTIENYCRSPKPSKLKHELSVLQEFDEEFIVDSSALVKY